MKVTPFMQLQADVEVYFVMSMFLAESPFRRFSIFLLANWLINLRDEYFIRTRVWAWSETLSVLLVGKKPLHSELLSFLEH